MRYSLLLSASYLALVLPRVAQAGGVHLRDITIDGRPASPDSGVSLVRGSSSTLCFALEGYSYSARPNESAYLAFLVSGAAQNSATKPSYFALELPRRLAGDRPDNFRLNYCVPLPVPNSTGQFVVVASRIMMFPSDFKAFDTLAVAQHARQHFARYEGNRQILAKIVTRAPAPTSDIADFQTYLRLDGKVPGSEALVVAGVGRPPVVFSWFVKPAKPEVEHRYRLYPTQKDWTEWDTVST